MNSLRAPTGVGNKLVLFVRSNGVVSYKLRPYNFHFARRISYSVKYFIFRKELRERSDTRINTDGGRGDESNNGLLAVEMERRASKSRLDGAQHL